MKVFFTLAEVPGKLKEASSSLDPLLELSLDSPLDSMVLFTTLSSRNRFISSKLFFEEPAISLFFTLLSLDLTVSFLLSKFNSASPSEPWSELNSDVDL